MFLLHKSVGRQNGSLLFGLRGLRRLAWDGSLPGIPSWKILEVSLVGRNRNGTLSMSLLADCFWQALFFINCSIYIVKP